MTQPVRPSDLPGIERLLRNNGLPVAGIADHLGGFEVARDSETILAVCGLEVHEREGLLRSLAVAPEARGRGLGAAMVARTGERARGLGVTRLWLLTETAQAWFERLGWRAVPRAEAPDVLSASVEFRGACPDSAVLMTLNLSL